MRSLWRKKRTAVPQIPDQSSTTNHHTTQSPPKKDNRHISHNRHHSHQPTRNMPTLRQVIKLLQGILPRQATITLQVSPLTNDFQASTETQTSHLLFLFFFIRLLFSSFHPFLLHFSRLLPSFLPCLSHLPSASCSRSLLHAWLCIHSLTASPSSLGNFPLSFMIFSFAKFHKPFL